MFRKSVFLLILFSFLTGLTNGQESEVFSWRILISDKLSQTIFWLYPDGTHETVYSGEFVPVGFQSSYQPALSRDAQYLAYVDDEFIIILQLLTGETTRIQLSQICTECSVMVEHQVGAFSPDARQWAVGYAEYAPDVPGGIAIFDVETGDLITTWRLEHPYFASENPRYWSSVYVGGWNETGILFFTWCEACDSPLGNFNYTSWNPLTNEVNLTGEFYDALDEIDILANTNEVVMVNTNKQLPFIREYYDRSNVLEYWANGYQFDIFTDRPTIFYDPMYNDLQNPVWIMNGDAVYLRAGTYADSLFGAFRTILIFRDGRHIETKLVEEGETALHGTPDGWLSVSKYGEIGQQLYAYHVDDELVSREEIFSLTPQSAFLHIESTLRPSLPEMFNLTMLPPATTCSNWQGFGDYKILLQEGGIGRVISESPVDVRNQPFGDSIGQIPNGSEFDIWDGPVCDGNGSALWLIQASGTVGWISEQNQAGVTGVVEVPPFADFDGTCSGFLPSRLVAGAFGRVTPGDANNVRSIPHPEGRLVGQISEGGVFQVLQGPICYNNTAYWKVHYHGLIGWTSEGQDNTYWLEPLASQSPTLDNTR